MERRQGEEGRKEIRGRDIEKWRGTHTGIHVHVGVEREGEERQRKGERKLVKRRRMQSKSIHIH